MSMVKMCGIGKQFGNVAANSDVNFELLPGEIHALLGENGAGKTTLMNILYGMYSSDTGNIMVGDELVSIRSPKDAIALGIGMVHQHFMLVNRLNVTQNIILGMKEAGFNIDYRRMHQCVREESASVGFSFDPKTSVWQLPVGVQQKVEILKIWITVTE